MGDEYKIGDRVERRTHGGAGGEWVEREVLDVRDGEVRLSDGWWSTKSIRRCGPDVPSTNRYGEHTRTDERLRMLGRRVSRIEEQFECHTTDEDRHTLGSIERDAAATVSLARQLAAEKTERPTVAEAMASLDAATASSSGVDAVGVVNGMLSLDAAITHKADELKCYTRDLEGGGVAKTYLGADDCRVLSAAFLALAVSLATPKDGAQ